MKKDLNVLLIFISIFFISNTVFGTTLQHFTGSPITSSLSQVFIGNSWTIDSIPLTDGDEVAAFDSGGVIVGADVINGVDMLTVYGDDPNTTADDGANAGEILTFKVWNHNTNTEYTVNQYVPISIAGQPESPNPPQWDGNNVTYGLNFNVAPNASPTAVATATPASLCAGATSQITLDGSASSDTDGSIVSYAWTQTAGTSVSLSDASAQSPTFTAPDTLTAGETLTFQLTVTDDGGATGTATVDVTVTGPATVDTFTADSATICSSGSGTTLHWTTTGATSVTLDDGTGPVSVEGTSKTVSPATTTNYTLTASNACGQPDSKTVTVTVDNAPEITSFSAAPDTICKGGLTSLSWTVTGADTISIDNGVGTVTGTSTSVSPSVTTTYTLTATNSCGSNTATVEVTVTDKPLITTFTAEHATICKGSSTSLSWLVSADATISIDNGVEAGTGNTVIVSPTETTTYTLTAHNDCGDTTATVTVTVTDKPVVSAFTAADATICKGGSTTLNWTVADADTITIDNGVGTVTGTSTSVSPTETTTYTLTAHNDCGDTTATVTVTVADKPVISAFTAADATICAGGSTSLSWTVTGADTISIDNSVGDVTEMSSTSVSPTTTTIYTLTAANACGTTTSETVTVNVTPAPVVGDFSASPAQICKGQSATLSSTVSGATSMSIDHGVGSVGGGTSTAVVSPTETTTYTLTADNGACQVTDTVTVTVNDKPEITSFTATPSSVLAGGSVTLSWTVNGADSVEIGDETGLDPASGDMTVNPTENTTYTLTATNGCGDNTSDVDVTIIVNNPPDKPEMISPSNGATGVSLMPELKAGAYYDADNDAQTMTWWQISTDSTFTDDDKLVYNEKTDQYLQSIIVPPNLILDVATMYYWRVRYFDGKNWSDSDIYSFTTTADGAQYTDGVQNGDRIPDNKVQNSLVGFADEHGKPVNTPIKKAFVSKVNNNIQIGLEATGAIIDRCGALDPKDFKGMAPRVPRMPFGLIEIALTVPNPGDTATVTVHFSKKLPNANDFIWWKFDPNRGEFYDYGLAAADAGLNNAVVVSSDRMSVTLKLKDGGPGDLIGTPDGRIIDPSGVGDEGGGSNGGTCFIDTMTR